MADWFTQPKPSVGKIIILLMLLAAGAWLGSLIWLRQNATPRFEMSQLGTLPPDWQLQPLDGEEIAIGDLGGQALFINIWASWCGPCLAEMPSIRGLRNSLAEDKLAFVIVTTEAPETAKAAADRHDFGLPIYTADNLPFALQTEAIPATFIVDSNGNIVFQHIGAADWDSDAARAFLRRVP